ncbi:hypothetical protein HUG20_11520 [Salicibibacter cibi]|uniref:Uncharacterized protein n=1 Tax=Salicibibacter cibi TaxID=2743001 RepID=A0A7T6ZBH9_9BACI|nr:hypothetical protein [Salicibibacter cibi]QQK80460.1 hypothetical protein HUG20_11520 [Salicibibacter cibi]
MSANRDFSKEKKKTLRELENYIDNELNGVYAHPNDSEEWLEETRRIVKEMKEKDPNVPSTKKDSYKSNFESKSSK